MIVIEDYTPEENEDFSYLTLKKDQIIQVIEETEEDG